MNECLLYKRYYALVVTNGFMLQLLMLKRRPLHRLMLKEEVNHYYIVFVQCWNIYYHSICRKGPNLML